MDLKLRGRVALITGASKGIGFHTAMALAREGCHLAICGREPDSLESAAEALAEQGSRVLPIQADVTNSAQASEVVDACATMFGHIDILINNVGGASGGSFMESGDQAWEHTFELNLFQVARMIRLAVPYMPPRSGSAIVNIASISGWQPPLASNVQYGASKAALIFMTERLALDLRAEGIRVNTVSPGSIMIEGGYWDHFRQQYPDGFAAYVEAGFPMGRLGTPEEVADVVAFIASPRSHWINGRHIQVDGLQQAVDMSAFQR